jgi:hypothetical protein
LKQGILADPKIQENIITVKLHVVHEPNTVLVVSQKGMEAYELRYGPGRTRVFFEGLAEIGDQIFRKTIGFTAVDKSAIAVGRDNI